MLLTCYHAGLEVGRYISLEQVIEENKERYYETLRMSSQGWHAGKHDPWPYIGYVLYALKEAYKEFEERVKKTGYPKGEKTQLVHHAIGAARGAFTLAEIEAACPGVSRDMVRKVLKDLQAQGMIECMGRGPGARWEKR